MKKDPSGTRFEYRKGLFLFGEELSAAGGRRIARQWRRLQADAASAVLKGRMPRQRQCRPPLFVLGIDGLDLLLHFLHVVLELLDAAVHLVDEAVPFL